jgi:alpha-N-arabinofuranosidase
MFYGLMTEEINHSYDGGLYAELIRNRSFNDDADQPVHWTVVTGKGDEATLSLDKTQPLNSAQPVSLKLDAHVTKGDSADVINDGFWGIPVKPDTTYRASFFARAQAATDKGLIISLQSADGSITYASAQTDPISTDWKQYTVSLKTGGDVKASATNRFVISKTDTPATIWFSQVSLFPPTWHDRPNGNRADLMQLMADLKPAFLRCPGGNYLEGDTVATRFDWLKTIGDISQRPGHMGCWTYRSSDGLGLLEFLEWAEDIGANPVLAVYAGYSLNDKQFRNGVPAGEQLRPFVQEALDEIQYATGSVDTKWGAKRAADGHPAPFKIEYIEIGNEDFLGGARKTYDARFAQFYDALKSAYPQFQYIATTPVRSRRPDAVDDHYYKTSDEMAGLAHRYDKQSRSGPKVFVGEWATREIAEAGADGQMQYKRMPWGQKGMPTPTLHAALGDAAFMTGMERNADVVVMNCYAPMLTRVEEGAAQWCPNMIGYNAVSSFGSPSYYAQQMFNTQRGDTMAAVSMDHEPKNFFYSATRSANDGTIYLKAVNRTAEPVTVHINLEVNGSIAPEGELSVLSGDDAQAVNSIDEPRKIVPTSSTVQGISRQFEQTFAANSANVLTIRAK